MSAPLAEGDVRGAAPSGALRAVLVAEGLATVFTFVQFLTAGEFIRTKGPTGDAWTNAHGLTAYGVLVPALIGAVVSVIALRRALPRLTLLTVALFVAAVGQWGSGHLISTLGEDGWTPFHVFFSSVVLALVVWTTVRAALLLRAPHSFETSN